MTRLVLLLLLFAAAPAAAVDCDSARLAASPSANSAVDLYRDGLAALRADDFGRADLALRQAYAAVTRMGDDPAARGLDRAIVARLVETALAANDPTVAYFRLRVLRAATAKAAPEAWIAQVMRAADAATVAVPESPATLAALTGCRSFGVAPSADVRVLFDYDSSTLTPAATAQVRTLAASLVAAKVDAALVRGHTDRHGTDAYNLALSTRRAQAVARELQAAVPALVGRIRAEGAGRGQLLYPGDTTDDDRLNRRVELVLGAR